MSLLDYYEHCWLVDFEFGAGDSGHDAPEPRCMVAHDYLTGEKIRMWLDGTAHPACPLTLDDRSLYVAFYAAAETSCHVSLGWPMPRRVLALYAELRWFLNGRRHAIDGQLKQKNIGRHSQLAALYYFGLNEHAIQAAEKDDMRALAMAWWPLLAGRETSIYSPTTRPM